MGPVSAPSVARFMVNQQLKERVSREILPRVQTPGQYIGGEWGAVRKDHAGLRGRMCLVFPDRYSIGMSHHGLQVLYAAVNRRSDWVCERAFAPDRDIEKLMREHGLPWYSLESFTPLADFDVVGFTLQYDLCCSNVLTMLDLGGIPLRAADRNERHPLVVAGGPSAMNPEPIAPFVDLFVIGDGEESLPAVCAAWAELKAAGVDRTNALAQMARRLPYVYAPQLYEPIFSPEGRQAGLRALLPNIPDAVQPAVVRDLDALPLPVAPVVPYVECVHDRIAIEIMRGCPGHCRFCQSTTLKRPLRMRSIDTIIAAALATYRNTGLNEISLLSLSTSDYPHYDVLMQRLQETFRPLGVSISMPSLRINEQLAAVGRLMNTDRSSGLTLAPEAARDDMRRQIGKRITNEDLYAGCRSAFQSGFQRVKLYFMCGLPGERQADLDGIVEMAETISRIGKEVQGRFATVVANVSNFVPKPHTPFQWHGMQTREYFREAHQYLRRKLRLRCVQVKAHDVDTSLLEGVMSRGDRRLAPVIEQVWRQGARFDAWPEELQAELWWNALDAAGIDWRTSVHAAYPLDARLPWDHLGIRQGRRYLERQQALAAEVQAEMCEPM